MELQAVAAALAALRLLQLGLARRQPALFCFLIITAAGHFFLSLSAMNSSRYFWGYMTFLPVGLLAEIAVVREIFEVTMSDYPGIRSAANRSMYGAMAFSVIVSFTLTAFLRSDPLNHQSNLYYILQFERSVQSGLAIVVVSLLLFLSRYPLRLHRNIYVSSFFFCAVFLIEAADSQVAALSPHLYSRQIDTAAVLLSCVLCVGWTAMLRPQSPVTERPALENGREQELLMQLESLNRILSQAGRQ